VEYDYEVGVKGNKVYSIVARATPDLNDPSDFSTSLIYHDRETMEKTEIARIDNSHGKGTHIHRLYRRDEPEEPFDGDLWDAMDHLQDNWRTYARSHLGA